MRRYLIVLLFLALPFCAQAQTSVAPAQITPASGAYSKGNCLGGILTITGAVTPGQHGTITQSVTVVDPTGQDAPIDFLFFSVKPTGTYTDNAACAISTTAVNGVTDAANLIGIVNFTSYTTYGTPGAGTTSQLAIPMTNAPGGGVGVLWAVPVVQGTPTYGSSKTLYISFGVLPDGPQN